MSREKRDVVEEGIARTVPKIVITPMESIDPTPVVNQPVFAPEETHQQHFGNAFLAPAVAVNNVAQELSSLYRRTAIGVGAVVGEGVAGGGCTVGATFGALKMTEQMGASGAVINGVTGGTAGVGLLCTVGGIVATIAYCLTKM